MLFSSRLAFSGRSLNIDYLVIAGGGSGASASYNTNYGRGGGGAGGYLSGSNVKVSSCIITVGAGGVSYIGSNANGGSGSDSSINSVLFNITATGGGGGNLSGGSGGGTHWNGIAGTGIPGQGFNGANGPNDGQIGGGGGAGQAGTTGATTAKGGDGKAWVDGVTRAGGGGGSRRSTALSGLGGAGGGGRGANFHTTPKYSAGSGTINTGSGGGVGWPEIGWEPGGAGGSGVVIIRYLGAPAAIGGTIVQSGSYTYHTFNSSGAFII